MRSPNLPRLIRLENAFLNKRRIGVRFLILHATPIISVVDDDTMTQDSTRQQVGCFVQNHQINIVPVEGMHECKL